MEYIFFDQHILKSLKTGKAYVQHQFDLEFQLKNKIQFSLSFGRSINACVNLYFLISLTNCQNDFGLLSSSPSNKYYFIYVRIVEINITSIFFHKYGNRTIWISFFYFSWDWRGKNHIADAVNS